MLYLHLDESGDLGFDFLNKRPSNFFTICILVTSCKGDFFGISNAVKKTIKRKLNKNSKKNLCQELKGNNTALEVKKYFWELVKKYDFKIYAMTLNKKSVHDEFIRQKERLYNFIARLVIEQIPIEQIPLEKAYSRVQIVVDKSKPKNEIDSFNKYIITHLESRLNPKVIVNIDHRLSQQEFILQAVDLFAWGIFRKYEKQDSNWLDYFKDRVFFDGKYDGKNERAT